MAGEITYMLTEADYATAQRTAFVRSLHSWRVFRTWLVTVASCGAIGACVSLGERTLGARLMIMSGFVAWGAISLPLCWALSYLLIPRRSRRLYRQQRSLHTPWTYRWSDVGLENEGTTGLVRFKWDELHAWTRSSKVFLFYANDILFHMLPLRVLTAGQISELETLLTRNGPARR